MTKGVIRDFSCKRLGDLKIVLLFCSENLLRVSFDISLRYVTTSIFGGDIGSLKIFVANLLDNC